MADEDADAVLSDVDEEDTSPNLLPSAPSDSDPDPSSPDRRIKDLLADLDRERQARKSAEDARSELQNSLNRLKVFAHEVIRKRDDAQKERDEAVRNAERITGELSEAIRAKEEASRQRDEVQRKAETSRSEIETAAQMMVTGIEKISAKVRSFKNFSAGGLPRSDKYTGLPAVAYGVIKRANEIVEELVAQVESAGKSRDEARELVEQRNYEIAIEVSQLEATIAGLRDEIVKKGEHIEKLEKAFAAKDMMISKLEIDLIEAKKSGEESEEKVRNLQAKLDAQRMLVIEQLNYISKAHEQMCDVVKNADVSKTGQSDFSESAFMWKEIDMDENLRMSLDGTVSLYELAKVAAGKVAEQLKERNQEVGRLNESMARMLAEKQHIGTLLRSALLSRTSEVRQVAEDGLREVGIDLKFDSNGHIKQGGVEGQVDEVYTLAGALESTVKASQIEIVELRHLVEALRAESSLLKEHLDAQAKEIARQKHHIMELEEKEKLANENVEGLMTDISAAEEEIERWKAAAEQEAAAGQSIEQEFSAQFSALRQELEEAKQAVLDLENKFKFKEETAAAALAARDAAENSLRLADLRSTRLRDRIEELTQQLENLDSRNDGIMQNRARYVCWPWQWLGLNYVRYQGDVQESTNEMELSEPLL